MIRLLLTTALLAAAAAEEETRELPIPPWAFGLIAISLFVALLGLTYSFRNTGTKHKSHSEGS